jgi:hypothetical protein
MHLSNLLPHTWALSVFGHGRHHCHGRFHELTSLPLRLKLTTSKPVVNFTQNAWSTSDRIRQTLLQRASTVSSKPKTFADWDHGDEQTRFIRFRPLLEDEAHKLRDLGNVTSELHRRTVDGEASPREYL